MALPDLTGQNIQDTYQRVLQTDGGTLRDGTGSLVNPTVTDLTVTSTGSFGRILCTTISASTGQFDDATIFLGDTSLAVFIAPNSVSNSSTSTLLSNSNNLAASLTGLVSLSGWVFCGFGLNLPSRLFWASISNACFTSADFW